MALASAGALGPDHGLQTPKVTLKAVVLGGSLLWRCCNSWRWLLGGRGTEGGEGRVGLGVEG